ncbi:MAG: hypothetical protein LBO08_01120 [Rickettsiales bacterium]|jgi:hypothetical protein|nr:hypothetical protein [Rickettsiales bacterium]
MKNYATNSVGNIALNIRKFRDAEEIWFWFLHNRATRTGFCGDKHFSGRPCSLIDVESRITRAYLCGKLRDDHLAVIKKFGDIKRAPHQHIFAENRAAVLWREAMAAMASVMSDWIER